jgi:hypothetical protein
MIKTATNIMEYLASLYTDEGLFDPIEGKVLPNKYGNSFYALGSALLFEESKNEAWKQRAEFAVKIELQNTKNRFKKIEMFRWEFKNYALLKLAKLKTTEKYQNQLNKRIKEMQDMGSFRANWMAMRGLNLELRYQLYKNPNDHTKSKIEIRRSLQRQSKEGFLCDSIGDNSFQYHCYTLAILIQYYDLNQSLLLRERIEKALEILIKITDHEGNCMYFGRGQMQIFGFVSAIYAFSYAYKNFDEKYGPYAKLVYNFIKPTLDNKRIIANEDEKSKSGWYKYNYVTDYLPFAATYLLMASKFIDFDRIQVPKKQEYEVFLPNSNLFLKSTADYFVCICSGNKMKSELPGLVHMYPKIIPCAGGPHVNEFGKDYSNNFIGIGMSNLLLKEKGKFRRTGNQLDLIFNLRRMTIKYSWFFGKDLEMKISISPKIPINISPIHYVSWNPLDENRMIGKILTPMGVANEYAENKKIINKKISRNIILFRGHKLPKSIIAIQGSKDKTKNYLMQKLMYFLKLGVTKLVYNPKDFVYSIFFLYTRNSYKRSKSYFLKNSKRNTNPNK